MSRVNSSSLNRHTSFEFPQPPLSPPDTNTDIIGSMHIPTPSSALVHELRPSDVEASPTYTLPIPESAGARFRKISSIAYHNSGIRESRERVPQRSPRAFVIILPPATFTQEHGQLGHTLSSGPRHRLSQGLIMPLFPTMYGQLTAIAREFNFPSITGLCLYPHFVENGVTMTPRISDDTWPLVWSHIFEASSPPVQRSPINGKIEFDIDLRQARWYTSWMSSSHRDYLDPFSTHPSTAPSVAHFRGESKTTLRDDQADNQEDSRMTIAQNNISAPTARHVPRKLSLVDRYDAMSTRSVSRPASRSALSPPEQAQVSSALSPIFQEEEPQSARHALDTRVKSWRASAMLNPTPLAARGQTSLEPANMPNTLPIEDTLLITPDDDLDLADFAWSVSSIGPNDYDPLSPISWDRVPSVHIANRIEGSVCMTPSDCTSFGPSDYTLPLPGPSSHRVPSPDIAHRMYEDVPLTPSTATSWGAPLSYPPSPSDFYQTPSIDLGERFVFSRPVSPSTATSWGPISWPISPLSMEFRPRSVDLGDRGDYSRPVTPSTATSWGAPLSYPPSPTTPFYVTTPDIGYCLLEDSEIQRLTSYVSSYPRSDDFPNPLPIPTQKSSMQRFSETRTVPWAFTWPYHNLDRLAGPFDIKSFYPRLVIYQSVYPHFDLYPAVVLCQDTHAQPPELNLSTWSPITPKPRTVPWAFSWPYYNLGHAAKEDSFTIGWPSNYPHLVIYQPVYPYFELYPAITPERDAHAPLGYPHFNLYPPVQSYTDLDMTVTPCTPSWPCYNLNLSYATQGAIGPITTRLPSAYPHLVIYQPIYPHFDLYPAVTLSREPRALVASPGYPHFNLYPPSRNSLEIPNWPQFGAPQISTSYPSPNIHSTVYPESIYMIYPPISIRSSPSTSDGKVSRCPLHDSHSAAYPHKPLKSTQKAFGYPDFNIYPTLDDHHHSDNDGTPVRNLVFNMYAPSISVISQYPLFDLYPAVYPYVSPYPIIPLDLAAPRKTSGCPHFDRHRLGNKIAAKYPDFDLFNARTSELSVQLCSYPVFNLYPAVYPAFNIYPLVERNSLINYNTNDDSLFELDESPSNEQNRLTSKSLSVRLAPSYPIFRLYPTIYPFIEIYPTSSDRYLGKTSSGYFHLSLAQSASPQCSSSNQTVNYPIFNLYPAVYPYFDLYPQKVARSEGRKPITVAPNTRYPAFDLYPAMYPYFDLWPSIDQPRMTPLKISSRLTHSELHAMVMMERIGSAGSFRSRETTKHLHNISLESHPMFPGIMAGTKEIGSAIHNRLDELNPPRASVLRRSSTKPSTPPAPSPNRRLPSPPTSNSRLSSAFESIQSLQFDGGVYPVRSNRQPQLYPQEDADGSIPSKLGSIRITPNSVIEHSNKLERSGSLTTSRPIPKRDSIVLQRVRAYNSSQDSYQLPTDTPSKSGALPVQPAPRATATPSRPSNYSKYAFN